MTTALREIPIIDTDTHVVDSPERRTVLHGNAPTRSGLD
jgi:hypothetical protein